MLRCEPCLKKDKDPFSFLLCFIWFILIGKNDRQVHETDKPINHKRFQIIFYNHTNEIDQIYPISSVLTITSTKFLTRWKFIQYLTSNFWLLVTQAHKKNQNPESSLTGQNITYRKNKLFLYIPCPLVD